MFGPQQPLAVDAARQLEDEFYEVARLFLSEEEVAKLREDVEGYSAGRVISGRDFTVANLQR